MIFKQPLLAAGLLLAGSIFGLSCTRRSDKTAAAPASDSAQYSIRAYARGQIGLLYDQPLTLYRVVREGDVVDSSLLPITQLNWKEVIPAFVQSDISAPRFIGQYRFSIADDNLTATRILSYEALRPDLFTRLFQINTDISNHMVKSIYVETRKSGFWKSTSQKLLYVPNRVIQIQETDDPLIGATTQRRIEYIFPRDEGAGDVHIVE